LLAAIAVLAVVAAVTPAAAQQRNSDGSPDPTASVVDQKTLLREFPRIEGASTSPISGRPSSFSPRGESFSVSTR
jgi:formate dehydrogenase subunit gamma